MTARYARAGIVLALTAASTLAAPAAGAEAAGTAGYCPDASGVTVVVAFNELGGGTVVRCAHGDQATGLTALKNAGFPITGTLRWGEGFICRIEGKPSAAAEKCVDTPPASAYWSYWHASNGGGWTYSDKGVANRRPPAGSFEGWSFSLNRGSNDAPRPDVVPKRPAPPAPPAPPPATGGGGPVATPPAAGGGPVAPPAQGGRGAAPPGGRPGAAGPTVDATGLPAPTGTATGAPSPTPSQVGAPTGGATGVSSPGASGPELTDVAAPRDGAGPPFGTIAGVLLLVLLAGGGLIAARRRRTTEPDA
ncbi:hypothetical protein [Micromonospora sp. WMMD975]|uniref:hypothetical protein n=1 Tax=Micromonospora sp. WMMD975 TaxID=3016087 RepID=UPI00249C9E46|nr:hypothetical protein [Micromonospora sp. WMMD975]WFE32680.1 hypothetical protein O7613_24455 [Micromonospora sp. WMMD975]